MMCDCRQRDDGNGDDHFQHTCTQSPLIQTVSHVSPHLFLTTPDVDKLTKQKLGCEIWRLRRACAVPLVVFEAALVLIT